MLFLFTSHLLSSYLESDGDSKIHQTAGSATFRERKSRNCPLHTPTQYGAAPEQLEERRLLGRTTHWFAQLNAGCGNSFQFRELHVAPKGHLATFPCRTMGRG